MHITQPVSFTGSQCLMTTLHLPALRAQATGPLSMHFNLIAENATAQLFRILLRALLIAA